MDHHNHSAMITNDRALINTTTLHVHNNPTTIPHVTTIMDHSGHDMSTMDQSSGGMNNVMMMSVRKERKNNLNRKILFFGQDKTKKNKIQTMNKRQDKQSLTL